MIKSLDESVGRLTSSTEKRLKQYLNTRLEKYDITAEQWTVLLKLSIEDNINQKKLAEKADKDQPTLARILDILERKNLIERKSNKEDRRSFIVSATEKGRNLKEEIEPFLEDIFKEILKGISAEEMEIYIGVLLKINDNIKENVLKKENVD